MSKSKRLEIIFHNGEPDGIRLLMRHLSTIKTYVVPRQYLNEAKELTGINNPGVYYLVNDEAGMLTKLYIGQTRNGISKLDDHNAKKDFWNKAILFLADSEHFTLNILSGLEKFAIQTALDAKRYDLDNKTVPQYKISEYVKELINYTEEAFIQCCQQKQDFLIWVDGLKGKKRGYYYSKKEDTLLETTRGYGDTDKPEDYLESFTTFVNENRDRSHSHCLHTSQRHDPCAAERAESRAG